jgi:hypothetical protein
MVKRLSDLHFVQENRKKNEKTKDRMWGMMRKSDKLVNDGKA